MLSDYCSDSRNGNMVGYGGNSLSYDAQNKWTSGTVNNQSVMFGYDGRDRRVSRTVGTGRTDYWYDRTGLIQETGAVTATYLRDLGGGLLSRTRNGYLVNYGTDRLGNVTALTGTDGSLADSYAYDPWGKEVANGAAAWYNPYRYTGTYLDEATGLYQMGARYFDPGSGRFTQMDPVNGSNWGGKSYDYTGGNPVNYTDPTGLEKGCRGIIAVGTAESRLWPHPDWICYGLRIEWCYNGSRITWKSYTDFGETPGIAWDYDGNRGHYCVGGGGCGGGDNKYLRIFSQGGFRECLFLQWGGLCDSHTVNIEVELHRLHWHWVRLGGDWPGQQFWRIWYFR